jgi:hypothetical protein
MLPRFLLERKFFFQGEPLAEAQRRLSISTDLISRCLRRGRSLVSAGSARSPICHAFFIRSFAAFQLQPLPSEIDGTGCAFCAHLCSFTLFAMWTKKFNRRLNKITLSRRAQFHIQGEFHV